MLVAQSCPTLYDPMECSLPGSSVHEILQTRILEWVAFPFSKWRELGMGALESEGPQFQSHLAV